jgi:hypothetical protein
LKKVLILISFFLLANVGCTVSDPEMMELLQEIKAQNDKLLQEVEAMKGQLSLLDGKYQVILASLADNKKELEALKSQIDALKAQIAQQLIKIDQLSAQLTQQGADIIKLSQEIKDLKASCDELKALIEELLSNKSPVPTNGLVGWWPFNGNANDESGNGNNGTVNGASLTTDRLNSTSKAYGFNGTSNYISLKNTFFSNPSKVSAFTYSFWINISSFPSVGKAFTISGKEGYWRSVGISLLDNGKIQFAASQPSPQGYFDVRSTKSIETLKWSHIIVSFKDGVVSIFINGELNITQIVVDPIRYPFIEFEFLQQGNSTATNYLGAFHPVSPGITNHYHGKLDDFAIWNRVLTAAEISNIYKGEKF